MSKMLPLRTQRQTIQVAEQRWLGFIEYGAPTGLPVFYFHGLHGSHLEPFGFADVLAKEFNIRFIVVERPGYGLSTAYTNTLLDWPKDIEVIASHLSLEHFDVLGYSGGGPFVAACAYALPRRVRRAVIVAGLGPLDGSHPTGLEEVSRFYPTRILFWVSKFAPWLIRLPVKAMLALLRNRPWFMIRRMSLADQKTAEKYQLGEWFQKALFPRELRQNTGGAVADLRIAVSPWGFRLEDIQCPTFVFHGAGDKQCSPTMGRVYAENIPGAYWHLFEDVGHLLVFEYMREILQVLVEDK